MTREGALEPPPAAEAAAAAVLRGSNLARLASLLLRPLLVGEVVPLPVDPAPLRVGESTPGEAAPASAKSAAEPPLAA